MQKIEYKCPKCGCIVIIAAGEDLWSHLCPAGLCQGQLVEVTKCKKQKEVKRG